MCISNMQFIKKNFSNMHFTNMHFTNMNFSNMHFSNMSFSNIHFTDMHFTCAWGDKTQGLGSSGSKTHAEVLRNLAQQEAPWGD